MFDASTQLGANRYIWQAHSSDDDRVHSATLRDKSTYEMLGCLVYREDTAQFSWFPKIGDFDECHIDKSGRWLTSLENIDGANGEDSRRDAPQRAARQRARLLQARHLDVPPR